MLLVLLLFALGSFYCMVRLAHAIRIKSKSDILLWAIGSAICLRVLIGLISKL